MDTDDFAAAAVALLVTLAGRLFPKPGEANAFLVDFANDLDDLADHMGENPAQEALRKAVAMLMASEGGAP